jgi:hypothetical protein
MMFPLPGRQSLPEFPSELPQGVPVSEGVLLNLGQPAGPQGVPANEGGVLVDLIVQATARHLKEFLSIAVAVAIFVDPGEAGFCSWQMPFQQAFVTGRTPGGVQGNQIKRRGVVWRISLKWASSPKRISCRILPGSASR